MFNRIKYDLPKLIQENVNGIRRYVTPSGESYASVTTVLSEYNKEWLAEWRRNVGHVEANKISRIASTRGTIVHSTLERYLNNEVVITKDLPLNVRPIFSQIKKMVDSSVNNIHCLEDRLFSSKLRLAGTVDCVAEYNGVLSVIDFKSSKKLKEKNNIANYFMQGAAYIDMVNDNEILNLNVDQVVIMIGVDNENYGQEFVINGNELAHYRQELQKYIDLYYSKN